MNENVVERNAKEKGLTVIEYLDYFVGMCGSMSEAARQLQISRQRLYQIMGKSGASTRRRTNIVER